MAIYRRYLPHISEPGKPTFITWRLHGSPPSSRPFPSAITSGKAFAAMDRLLDEARSGPFYLSQPEIANMVVEVIHYNNAEVLAHYDLQAFVVMPNHVHILYNAKRPEQQSERIRRYVEQNPVRGGLVKAAPEFRWRRS